jgi:hypothetical protein
MNEVSKAVDLKGKVNNALIALSELQIYLTKKIDDTVGIDGKASIVQGKIDSLEKQQAEAERILSETKSRNQEEFKTFQDWKNSEISKINELRSTAESERVETANGSKDLSNRVAQFQMEKDEFDKKRRDLEERHAKINELARG